MLATDDLVTGRRPSLLRAAAGYSRRGWPVFPLWWPVNGRCACPDGAACERPAKHPVGPVVPHGLHDASSDPAMIRAWWNRYPLANIGLPTGVAFDVIDIDSADGLASIVEIERAGYPPKILGIVETGREIGWHLYVPPSGEGNRTRFAPGLDYRGCGGYVVAPPSLHISGRRYGWCR